MLGLIVARSCLVKDSSHLFNFLLCFPSKFPLLAHPLLLKRDVTAQHDGELATKC
jgi:hypothetical protein